MTDNPYAAPLATLRDTASPKVPEDVKKKIRYAWMAACVSGTLTLAFAITGIYGYTTLETVDAALIFGLALGIYKKSRICAVLTLVYFIASKIYMVIEAGEPRGLAMALVFGFFYYQGVIGTFEYQKIARSYTDGSQGGV